MFATFWTTNHQSSFNWWMKGIIRRKNEFSLFENWTNDSPSYPEFYFIHYSLISFVFVDRNWRKWITKKVNRLRINFAHALFRHFPHRSSTINRSFDFAHSLIGPFCSNFRSPYNWTSPRPSPSLIETSKRTKRGRRGGGEVSLKWKSRFQAGHKTCIVSPVIHAG